MATPPSKETTLNGAAGLRVLVADDEVLIRTALRRLLERRGHSVLEACDAAEAIALLGSGSFDAVLVDRRMPGEGTAVLAWLRENRFPGVVILMTGELAGDVREACEGVVRLQKPFPFPSVIPLVEGVQPT